MRMLWYVKRWAVIGRIDVVLQMGMLIIGPVKMSDWCLDLAQQGSKSVRIKRRGRSGEHI